MSTLIRSLFTFAVAAAIIGCWVPLKAQETEVSRPSSPSPQQSNGTTPADDDPYGPPPLITPGTPNPEAAEPVTSTSATSDSSTSNHETPAQSAMVAPPPASAAGPDLMHFEKDVAPAPSFETTETRREQAEALPEEANVPNPLPQPDALPALSIIPAFRLGPATMAVGVSYEAVHDNNILFVESGRQGDFEHIVSPRFSLGLGRTRAARVRFGDDDPQSASFLALDYNPQFILFQHYGQYNAFEQQLSLNAQYAMTRTVLVESLDYNHGSDPDRELQGRTSRDVLSDDTYATYRASERFSYELGGSALVRNFEQGIDSDEGRLRLWTRYRATPNWTASIGAVGGALLPEEGASQIFQQAWVATQNQIGTDLNVYLGMGADFREPQNTGQVLTTPVFNAIIRYEPSTETQLEILAIRQIFSSSDIVDQNFVSTRISIKATQRLWQTYTVGAEVGYENADYYQVGTQAAVPRSDNYPTAKLEFNYSRFEDLQAGIFYLVRKNFSSAPDASFSDQQFGAQLRIGY